MKPQLTPVPDAGAGSSDKGRAEGPDRAAARAARRNALLKAAADLLRAGEERFTTNVVAQRCGVPIGSLYKLFGDKDALLLALLDQEGRRFAAQVEPLAEAHTRLEASHRLVTGLIDYHRAWPRLAAALLHEEQRLEVHKPAGVFRKTDDAAFALLEAGASHLVDPTLAARSLALMLCGMAVAVSTAPERSVPEAAAGMLAALEGYLAWSGRGV